MNDHNGKSNYRVLLISPSFGRGKGGIENLMERIRSKSRHEFTVLTEDPAPDSGDRSMRVTRLGGALRVSRYLINNRNRYDVVYVSSARVAHLLLIPWMIGIPTIVHAHGSDIFFNPSSVKTWVRALLSRFLLRNVSRVIAVSEWTKEKVIQNNGIENENKVVLVPNGVDVKRFRNGNRSHIRKQFGFNENDFLLCTVARLDPRKGHRLVLEALPDLPNCKYLIVGTGPYEDRLRKMIRQKGLTERVSMAGFVSENHLPDVYDACDLFVMPSEHLEEEKNVEGFGISFLEANAAGKTVVGTRTGGIPTAVKHEETGLLCEPKVSSVRKAVIRLQRDNSFRRQLEKNGYHWARRHQWDRIVSRVDEIVESAISN